MPAMDTTVDLREIAVLVVDDLEDNLDLIEEYLEDVVWSVHLARSGDEAVRIAREHRPDIVLLDLMMPGMNGLSVVRAMRSTDGLRDVGIIMLTAHADRDNVLTARRIGCDHVLGKPIQRERLLSEITLCLKKRPPRPREAPPPTEPAKPRHITVSLGDALETIEAGALADVINDPETIDCLRELVADDSRIGQNLIRLANSPAYAGSQRVDDVARAIVRIGTRQTMKLIRKATSTARGRLNSTKVNEVLRLLEIVRDVFPDRTATIGQTRALLRDLSDAAHARRQEGDKGHSGGAARPAKDAAGPSAAAPERAP
jgi:CheY-like chemotaxis protein